MIVRRFGLVAAACSLLFFASQAHAISSTELKCSATLSKSFSKLQATILKTKASCHADDISQKENSPTACDPLPTELQEKITKARTKFVATVAKACSGNCSISTDKTCVTSLDCPARHVAAPPNNASAESCSGFNLRNLDWPGPYCESILGHKMTDPTDLGTCVLAMLDTIADPVHESLYADLDENSGLSEDAAACIAAIDKATSSAITKTYLATAACRLARRNNDDTNAWACALNDEDTVATIAKVIAKLQTTVVKKCHEADIPQLVGLCSAGGETPTTIAEAQSCLTAMVMELGPGEHDPAHHTYAPFSMLNVTHPDSAKAYCGDGIITDGRDEGKPNGEECDGSDAPCGGGSCLPPGDVFECTCDNTPRERFIVIGDEDHTDSDAGWKGSSHDATHNDNFGYVTELSDCDCSAISGATCTGSTGDSTCTVYGAMAPRCSDDLEGTETCDDRGNGNGFPENKDCFRCDDYSINAGAFCGSGILATPTDETACQSQCYDDATNLPVAPLTPCTNQLGCGDGQTCRGRCDNTITCNTMTEGSPLPQISAEIGVCIMLEYKTDITGTKNIVTGESALNYATRSIIRYGDTQTVPCPLCEGVCIGGDDDGDPCHGRCNSSGDECLIDADCTGPGDTTCVGEGRCNVSGDECTADADCTQPGDTTCVGECGGGRCSLELRCSNGSNEGRLCNLDAQTPLGAVSHDCPPDGVNVSGGGVQQNFGTVTTEHVEFAPGAPCTDATWQNFDCPCPADDGVVLGIPTRPNGCAAACDGGVNVGKGCATGDGGEGVYTTCVGGDDNGLPCDEPGDCELGTCTGNPRHCTLGVNAFLGSSCAVNADCGGGGLCEDACPGARCVPLCYPEGVCVGGARAGDPCGTIDGCKQCTEGNANLIGAACETNGRCDSTPNAGDGRCEAVGATCVVSDATDGICAAGPTKPRCTGAGHITEPCELNYGECNSLVCAAGSPSKRNLACTVNSDCLDFPNVPVSSGCETGVDSIPGTSDDVPGAGECEYRPFDCYVNNGSSEGGDTLNGNGSPTNVYLNAAFCTPPNEASVAINEASGFGGPSRIRRKGTAVINVPAIAP
jgi:hypothetical protein